MPDDNRVFDPEDPANFIVIPGHMADEEESVASSAGQPGPQIPVSVLPAVMAKSSSAGDRSSSGGHSGSQGRTGRPPGKNKTDDSGRGNLPKTCRRPHPGSRR